METPFHFHIENRAKKLTVLLHFSSKCCLASSVPSLGKDARCPQCASFEDGWLKAASGTLH